MRKRRKDRHDHMMMMNQASYPVYYVPVAGPPLMDAQAALPPRYMMPYIHQPVPMMMPQMIPRDTLPVFTPTGGSLLCTLPDMGHVSWPARRLPSVPSLTSMEESVGKRLRPSSPPHYIRRDGSVGFHILPLETPLRTPADLPVPEAIVLPPIRDDKEKANVTKIDVMNLLS